MAIRLALLAHHYRGDWTWTPHGLEGATERLERWRAATALSAGPDAQATLSRIREVLADDLRAPSALDAIDHWAHLALTRGGPDSEAPALIERIADTLLGVRLR